MDDPQWVKKLRHAERPGLYCRVIKEGMLTTGESVSAENFAGETLSILQMFRDYYEKHKSEETLRRHLKAPIAIRDRKHLEKELQHLLAQP